MKELKSFWSCPPYQDQIQSTNDSGYRFSAPPIRPFLACLYCQKHLKMKILIKNYKVLILENVLK